MRSGQAEKEKGMRDSVGSLRRSPMGKSGMRDLRRFYYWTLLPRFSCCLRTLSNTRYDNPTTCLTYAAEKDGWNHLTPAINGATTEQGFHLTRTKG